MKSFLPAALVAALLCGTTAIGQEPVWWRSAKSGAAAQDYAMANIGQAKFLTQAALNELSVHSVRFILGKDVPQFGWRFQTAPTALDYSALSIVQLKAMSSPFLARLQAQGFPTPSGTGFPWATVAADSHNAANLGQLKNVFAFSVFGTPRNVAVHPFISEVIMTTNPDRVEITNLTANPIQLSNYYITDDPDFRNFRNPIDATQLPNVQLPANGRYSYGLPFGLKIEGDYLGLFHQASPGVFNVVQEFVGTLPRVERDSFNNVVTASLAVNDQPGTSGYLTDWTFRTPTTFGQANTAVPPTNARPLIPPKLVVTTGDPKVKAAGRGLFLSSAPLSVVFEHEYLGQSDFEIRYTTNHTAPDADDTYYTPAQVIAINQSTTLKAVAVRNLPGGGVTISEPISHTFIAVDTVAAQRDPDGAGTAYPPSLHSSDPGMTIDYDMDPNLVGAQAGLQPALRTSLFGEFTRSNGEPLSVPSVFISMSTSNLFDYSGSPTTNGDSLFEDYWDTSTPVASVNGSIQFYDPANPSATLESAARFEVTGDSTYSWSVMKKKSLKVRFGELDDRGVYCDFFRDGKPGYTCAIALKAMGHDTWAINWGSNTWGQQWDAIHISDQMVSETLRAMGEDHPTVGRVNQPRSRMCHVYINNLYWGVYVLFERPDASYVATGNQTDGFAFQSLDDWEALGITYTLQNTQLEQYVDYIMAACFLASEDWPSNNIRTTGPRDGQPYPWHFYSWGMEYDALELWRKELNMAGMSWGAMGLYGNSTNDQSFRDLFRTRMLLHCGSGGALSIPRLLDRFNRLAENFEFVALAESARWGDTVPFNETGPDYAWGPVSLGTNIDLFGQPLNLATRHHVCLDESRTFLQERPTLCFQHFVDYFAFDPGTEPAPNPYP